MITDTRDTPQFSAEGFSLTVTKIMRCAYELYHPGFGDVRMVHMEIKVALSGRGRFSNVNLIIFHGNLWKQN